MRTVRAVYIICVFALMNLAMFPSQWLALWLDRYGFARTWPMLYHRLLCKVIGIRVHVHGEMASETPLLIVANHTSWLDIPIMSIVKPVSFIAKSEVERWPFFGMLSNLQQTVYIARGKRHDTDRQRNLLHKRLSKGDRLILFPEGTSSDGNRVLAFNSALFGVVERPVTLGNGEQKPILVQPVSLAYTKLQGLPMGRSIRNLFAWYGDMDLLPHLWGAFSAGPIDVDLTFHRPVHLAEFGSRKVLSRHCQAEVAAGLRSALAGRPGPGPVSVPNRDQQPAIGAGAEPSAQNVPA